MNDDEITLKDMWDAQVKFEKRIEGLKERIESLEHELTMHIVWKDGLDATHIDNILELKAKLSGEISDATLRRVETLRESHGTHESDSTPSEPDEPMFTWNDWLSKERQLIREFLDNLRKKVICYDESQTERNLNRFLKEEEQRLSEL
jgi:hypothetical protein